MTRYADYEHNPIDIFGGFCLGAFFGILLYRMYYPSVFHPVPSIRAWPKLHPVALKGMNNTCCLHGSSHIPTSASVGSLAPLSNATSMETIGPHQHQPQQGNAPGVPSSTPIGISSSNT